MRSRNQRRKNGRIDAPDDPLSNVRSRSGPNALTYAYNATSNRLTGISGAQTRTYGYNAKGEITGDGTKTFTLNSLGQIQSITGIATYGYDGHGRRIKVTKSGSTEYTLYDRAGRLVYTELGTTKTDYLSVGGHTVVELKKTGTTTTPTYLHPDLLGSPRKATTQAKALLWSEHYDPYGLKLNGVNQKIGYTGHAHDAESGYTYMQARFYDPLVGRFLSTDPIHFVDENPFTFNRYAYANNNPYRYIDPFGLSSCGTGSRVKGNGGVQCRSTGSTSSPGKSSAEGAAVRPAQSDFANGATSSGLAGVMKDGMRVSQLNTNEDSGIRGAADGAKSFVRGIIRSLRYTARSVGIFGYVEMTNARQEGHYIDAAFKAYLTDWDINGSANIVLHELAGSPETYTNYNVSRVTARAVLGVAFKPLGFAAIYGDISYAAETGSRRFDEFVQSALYGND